MVWLLQKLVWADHSIGGDVAHFPEEGDAVLSSLQLRRAQEENQHSP
jgi:hypothetical protein